MSKAKKEAKRLAKKQKKQAAKTAMLKKTKVKVVTKIKKKHWYSIVAPPSLNERLLGKTLVTDANLLIGRTIKANLMQVTGDIKKQNSVITFKIIDIKDNKAVTRMEVFELLPASVRRFIRRSQNKVDWSFAVKSKDNVNARVKPLFITSFKCRKSARTAMIKKTEKILLDFFKKTTFDNAMKEMISFKLESDLKKQMCKIYPLKIFKIRLVEKFTPLGAGLQSEEETETAPADEGAKDTEDVTEAGKDNAPEEEVSEKKEAEIKGDEDA